MILSFWTEMSGKTSVDPDLEEQSDEGLHCLPFRLRLFNPLLYRSVELFKF